METIVFHGLEDGKHSFYKIFPLLLEVCLRNRYLLPREFAHRSPENAFWEMLRVKRVFHEMQERAYKL